MRTSVKCIDRPTSTGMAGMVIGLILIAIVWIAMFVGLGAIAAGASGGIIGGLVGAIFSALLAFTINLTRRTANWLQKYGKRYQAVVTTIHERGQGNWLIEAWYSDEGTRYYLEWSASKYPKRLIRDGYQCKPTDLAPGDFVDVLVSPQYRDTYSMDLRKIYEKDTSPANRWR